MYNPSGKGIIFMEIDDNRAKLAQLAKLLLEPQTPESTKELDKILNSGRRPPEPEPQYERLWGSSEHILICHTDGQLVSQINTPLHIMINRLMSNDWIKGSL